MNRKVKIILVLFLTIVTLALAILLLASETQSYLFSKTLHIEEFVAEDGSRIANVTDAGVRIAGIYLRVEHPPSNSPYIPILVSIWHTEDTELDSMTLTFSTYPNHMSLYLEAPQSSWPETQFRKTNDGKGIVYSVQDLGLYGTGTVTLKLLVIQFTHSTSENNLQFTAEFSMHQETFLQLTALKTHATVYIPIPS